MPDASRLAAIVINWNGSNDTIELLSSLMSCQSEILQIKVVVIDNASARSDVENLRLGLAQFIGRLDISLRENAINVGVPAAYNQAIQIIGTSYQYYLRLDNDVTVSATGLLLMMNALRDRRPNGVAIVGGNVKFYRRPDEDNCGAVSIDLVKGKTKVEYPAEDLICDGVLGCIMLLDGDLVRRYAPDVFDPTLFICADESELSLRARRDGLYTYYVAAEIGLHKGGASTSKVNFLANYYSYRNWTILRTTYVIGWRGRALLVIGLMIDVAKSTVKRRWSCHLGLVSGIAWKISKAIDRRVRNI